MAVLAGKSINPFLTLLCTNWSSCTWVQRASW